MGEEGSGVVITVRVNVVVSLLEKFAYNLHPAEHCIDFSLRSFILPNGINISLWQSPVANVGVGGGQV